MVHNNYKCVGLTEKFQRQRHSWLHTRTKKAWLDCSVICKSKNLLTFMSTVPQC